MRINNIVHWVGMFLVPCSLLLAASGCQEEYDMELGPTAGAAQAAVGTYSGNWHLQVIDPNGDITQDDTKPGTIVVTAGCTVTDKEGNESVNADAATADFRCEELFDNKEKNPDDPKSYLEHVNVAKTAQGIVFFNKFDSNTQVGAAFAGSVSDQGAARVKFTVKKIIVDDWTAEKARYKYNYEFVGQR